MRGLDDTDREILRILLEDGRRPYSDIAEVVGLSAPAVSDRIDRLQEVGLLERFTVDLNRSMLRAGVRVLVRLEVRPGEGPAVAAALGEAEAVEHVFRTVDDRVLATATVPEGDVPTLLEDALDVDAVRDYTVSLLSAARRRPGLGEVVLAPECAECGNTVDAEGESATLGGEVYHFCCSSCRDNFVAEYERLSEGAER